MTTQSKAFSPFYHSHETEEFLGKRFLSLDPFQSAPPGRQQHTLSRLWAALESPVLLVLIGVLPTMVALATTVAIDHGFGLRGWVLANAGTFALVAFSAASACLASLLLRWFRCPGAGGSGVPEAKTALSGVVSVEHFSFKVLVVKMIGLVCSFSAGLSIGREGPCIHMACIIAYLLISLPLFSRTRQSSARVLELLACACAAGVAATFGTPFGGTLFSIEITATFFMLRNLPRAFLAAVCGSLVVYLFRLETKRTLALFSVPAAAHAPLHEAGDVAAVALLGVLCGLVGCLFIFVVSLCLRLRDRAVSTGRLAPVMLLVAVPPVLITLAGAYDVFLLRTADDVGVQVDRYIFDDQPLTPGARGVSPPLLFYLPLKLLFTAASIALPLPAGLFTPVFIMGGALGRAFAEVMQQGLGLATSLAPWQFAVVGAAALASGVTRTISTAVIVLELTGLHQLAFPMSVAIVMSYFICNAFAVNIYDFLVADRGVPHVPQFPRHTHRVFASHVMEPLALGRAGGGAALLTLESCAADLRVALSAGLQRRGALPFALVRSRSDMTLLGTVTRRDLADAVVAADSGDSARRIHAAAANPTANPSPPRAQLRGGRQARAPLLSSAPAAEPRAGYAYQRGGLAELTDGVAFVVATASGARAVLPTGGIAQKAVPAHVLRVVADAAPFHMSALTPLHKIELVFRMLQLNHVFLTRCGELVGVITRARLMHWL
eukprot:g5449.t1